jgi:3-isopropylmalate dehydrogenase
MDGQARLALLPGDGVGPEVVEAARRVLEAAAPGALAFDRIPCGGQYFLAHGRDWPDGAEARCDAADALLLGAVGWPDPAGGGPVRFPDGRMAGWSAVLGNRSRLDLYANVRPVRLLPGVRHRLAGRWLDAWPTGAVDLVIVRENTEDLYYGAGGTLSRGGTAELATDTRVITRRGSKRVLERAFGLAAKRRGKVTAVVKDNVLEGCRLFAAVHREVAASWPEVEAETMLVDACAQALLTDPGRFDVVVTTNLFGDILTDLAAVLQGGMGMAVGMNLGDAHAMFEPVHGSAPDLAETGRANPVAAILAGAEALRSIGDRRADEHLRSAARRIETAVEDTLASGVRTEDLGGAATTEAVTEAVCERV